MGEVYHCLGTISELLLQGLRGCMGRGMGRRVCGAAWAGAWDGGCVGLPGQGHGKGGVWGCLIGGHDVFQTARVETDLKQTTALIGLLLAAGERTARRSEQGLEGLERGG